jgi:dihydrodipicolinate synthase/N-acetylneuraminate lyase
MGLMKLCEPSLRLPLCEMLPENKEKLIKVLKEYGLI